MERDQDQVMEEARKCAMAPARAKFTQKYYNKGTFLKDETEKKKQQVEAEALDIIINQQLSDGTFEWNDSLIKILTQSHNYLAKNFVGVDDKIWLTILLANYLRIKLHDKKDFWELVVKKAEKILNELLPPEDRSSLERKVKELIS